MIKDRIQWQEFSYNIRLIKQAKQSNETVHTLIETKSSRFRPRFTRTQSKRVWKEEQPTVITATS